VRLVPNYRTIEQGDTNMRKLSNEEIATVANQIGLTADVLSTALNAEPVEINLRRFFLALVAQGRTAEQATEVCVAIDRTFETPPVLAA
jgi:hypothetical protein